MTSRLTAAAFLIASALAPAPPGARAGDPPPNILVIVADDLGATDLNAPTPRWFETPRLDRLASQGVRFTSAYASGPVCSPTRVALQTGLYQARFGLTAHIPGHWRPFERLVEPPNAQRLPLEAETLAERLRAAGYSTAYFGKWHLGGNGFSPSDQGYDVVFESGGHTIPGPRLQTPSNQPARACDELVTRALHFIEQHPAEPWLVQVHPFAVHIPLEPIPDLLAKYEAKPPLPGGPDNARYAAILEELDTAVGRLLDGLDQLDQSRRTLVVFTSDNGGLERESGGWPGTLNDPLRDEKGSLYEGGIRIPLLIRWPNQAIPGATCAEPVSSIDIVPTLLEAARLPFAPPPFPPDVPRLDGLSLLPLLHTPSASLNREALFWHYPHYHHSRPSSALRAGRYKLIEFFDTGDLELYDLAADPSESHNLAPTDPATTTRLHAALRRWRTSVNAQLPQPNPAFNPARAGEWWSRATLQPTEAPGAYYP